MNILVLPGGGAAGYTATVFLQHLETALDRPLRQCFQLIAGVSTGAIIGAGLSAGHRASELADFYQTLLPTIFLKKHWWSGWVSSARYESEPLERQLRRLMPGDWTDLRTDCMTYALSVEPHIRPKHWKSWAADHNDPIADVLMATCAAPSYFRPWHFTPVNSQEEQTYVDGGVISADPVMHAVAEAQRMGYRLDEIQVLNVNPYGYGGKLENARNVRSILQWAPQIGRVFLEAGNESAVYQAHQLLPGRVLDVELMTPLAMDDARPEALSTMAVTAAKGWESWSDRVIQWLQHATA